MSRRTRENLVARLHEQLRFIAKSGRDFDRGDISEAKRLATHVRTLVHDTGHSRSVLGQLRLLRTMRYFSQTIMPPYIVERSLMPICSLAPMWSDGTYRPICHDAKRPVTSSPVLLFDDWWNEAIANAPTLRGPVSRRAVIMALSNKEGGAHVDPRLKSEYEEMSDGERFGWRIVKATSPDEVMRLPQDAGIPIVGNIAAAVARQTAHELAASIRLQVHPESGDLLPVTFVPQSE